jgi:hypothetical protein
VRLWLDPGLLLRCFAYGFFCPFGPSAPQPSSGLPPDRAVSTLQARCKFHHRLRSPRFLPMLPAWTFTSLRIGAPARLRRTRSAFRIRPISSRSPQPFLSLVSGRGSSFLVRYVSGGLLFLKPLGTSFTMLLTRKIVKQYCASTSTFPQNLFGLFLSGCGRVIVQFLWKKQTE